MSATETLDPQQAEVHRLIEEQAALEDLQKHPGWAVFIGYVERWRVSHEAVLMRGGLTSMEEYKLHAGRLDGIRQVLSIPEVVATALERAKEPNEMWQDDNPVLDETRS